MYCTFCNMFSGLYHCFDGDEVHEGFILGIARSIKNKPENF